MKTPTQIARHWIVSPRLAWPDWGDYYPWILRKHEGGWAMLRNVGPYRVVMVDGKVIGHSTAEAR